MAVKARFFIRFWVPVLIWMALIFKASGDSGSFAHSSRIVAPLVRFLFPAISDAALHDIIFAVRKVAHVTEYAVLAVLFWRAMRGRDWAGPGWSWGVACRALLMTALYAATDEFHQIFVPHREASLIDVGIDTIGAAAGLALVYFRSTIVKRST